MRIDAWQSVWLCTAINSLMEHFVPISLPLWHFPPTVTLARFWHLIGGSAIKQPIRGQDYKSGPRVMRGDAGQLWSCWAQRKCPRVTQGTFVTPSSSGRGREREQQIFVTVSFYLCCKLWEDNNGVNVVKILIRSRPIISIVLCIEDWGLTLSHGPMLTEDERWERCWYVFVISDYLGSATLPHVRTLYLCWDGSQGVMCHTWRSWHVMPRCHTANICPGVAQHCHNGSRKLGAKLGSSDTSSTNYPTDVQGHF